MDKQIIVGITGASGAAYALRLLDCLEEAGVHAHVVVSSLGRRLLADEGGIQTLSAEGLIGRSSERLFFYDFDDLYCRLASGSFLNDGMVICPCSSNTLGAVAAGRADNLLTRAAMVTLKEARRLILVHREMPLSPIDLENMLKLSRAGAIICPAAPAFYTKPRTIDDLIDFLVGKVLDLLGIDHALNNRWSG